MDQSKSCTMGQGSRDSSSVENYKALCHMLMLYDIEPYSQPTSSQLTKLMVTAMSDLIDM